MKASEKDISNHKPVYEYTLVVSQAELDYIAAAVNDSDVMLIDRKHGESLAMRVHNVLDPLTSNSRCD